MAFLPCLFERGWSFVCISLFVVLNLNKKKYLSYTSIILQCISYKYVFFPTLMIHLCKILSRFFLLFFFLQPFGYTLNLVCMRLKKCTCASMDMYKLLQKCCINWLVYCKMSINASLTRPVLLFLSFFWIQMIWNTAVGASDTQLLCIWLSWQPREGREIKAYERLHM